MKRYEEALQLLLADTQIGSKLIPRVLNEALGYVTAHAHHAQINSPGQRQSSMDGYAVHGQDLAALPHTMAVSQKIFAGQVGKPLQTGTAARIFTGAVVPPGADTVLMQEVCQSTADGSQITVTQPVTAGEFVRNVGDDYALGEVLIEAGIRLNPAHIALLASSGYAQVDVYAPLRVAILTTGDELVEPGETLTAGKLYNSNRYMLRTLLQAWGCEVEDFAVAPDNLADTTALIKCAAECNDVVISTGGVSVGEADFIKDAVAACGKVNLWKIAIKPGKPLTYGRLGATQFFGLPGNPVSSFVTALMVLRPVILKKSGVGDFNLIGRTVTAQFDWPKPDQRLEFLRAQLNARQDAALIHPKQQAWTFTSASWADGLIAIPPGQSVKIGDALEYYSYASLGLT